MNNITRYYLLQYPTSYAQVEEGSRIGIQFEEFDLEDEENCEYDVVEGNELLKIFIMICLCFPSLGLL